MTFTIWCGTHNRARLQFEYALADTSPPPPPAQERLATPLSMTPLVSVLTGRGLTLLGYNPRLERKIVDGIIKGDKSNQPPPSPAPCSPEFNSQSARRPKRAIFPPLVRESRLRNPASFCCGILNPGLRNPEYSSRIPESNNDWGLESSLH